MAKAKRSGKAKSRAKTAKSKKLRAAVVGIGGIGRHHMDMVHKCPDSELVAVCDRNPDALVKFREKSAGAVEYEDCERMLAKEKLDLVTVALPNNLHAPVTIAALESGAHVLCEKPLATNAVDAQRMVDAAEARGLTLAVNLSYRFTPQSQFLHNLTEAGELGEVYFAHTVWHRRRGVPKGTGWFVNKAVAGGGPLIDLGVHRLDLAWWLMGCPRPLRASGVAYGKFQELYSERFGIPVTTEDLAAGFVRFEGGAALSVQASWAGNVQWRERMVTRVWGTRAGLVQENQGEGYDFTCRLFRSEGGAEVDIAPHGGMLPGGVDSVSNVCAGVLRGEPLVAPGTDGLAVQKMLDAIYRSSEQGREVEIE
ncbi:MAG: Gfo/Idh/MocA family protein [Planctomycetota bacterium]